jgi:tripartite-type tricarboxylate transporter receptor subunit TctC
MVHRRALLISCVLTTSALSGNALAQGYPDRLIKLIVPFAPGGATDILGRLLATALTDKLGQSVVVENKPGAGTALASSAVAKMPADGYNLLLASSSMLTLNPVVRQTLGYDPVASFTPIGQVADMSLVLVANTNTPGNTLKDILASAKAQPGKYAYGSFGAGSSVHFGGERLKSVSGLTGHHEPRALLQ